MKRTIFIGQAMPRFKKDPHDWPSLNKWLYSIELTDEDIRQNFFYSALVDYFPGATNGSHIVPSNKQISDERERLRSTILSFDPEIVVPVGILSISYCFEKRTTALSDYVGKSFKKDPYALLGRETNIIPLPHPSGASTWRYKPANKKLLIKALSLLKKEMNC